MSKLLEDFENASNDDLINAAQSIDVDSLYNLSLDSHIILYRARYSNGFDDTDPNQFSYIHDKSIIRQLRFNKDHEQVFYSATNPTIAYKEIEQPGNSGSFYISVWRTKEKIYSSFLFNPQKCKRGSIARKYAEIIEGKLKDSPVGYHYLENIGQLMEHEGTNYSFSSELASKIFVGIDALVSVSTKSDGSELNITFKKEFVDAALKMRYVLLCEKFDNGFFQVQKLGLLEGGTVAWYKLELDETSYKRERCANEKTEILWTHVNENPLKISPVSIDKCSIEDKKVHILIGGKDNPNFSYDYNLWKL